MTKYLILAAILILVVYGCIEAWPLVAGPTLFIASPENYATIPGGIVNVDGKASRAAELSLDGTPLLHKEDGTFSSILTLPRGSSILTLAATDRFGRTVTVTRSIFVP